MCKTTFYWGGKIDFLNGQRVCSMRQIGLVKRKRKYRKLNLYQIQCVKFIVQDIPFMLVATLFSAVFILRDAVYVWRLLFFFLSFVRFYLMLLVVLVYALTSFTFRRFGTYHMAYGLLFPQALHRSSSETRMLDGKCAPMEKSSETITGAATTTKVRMRTLRH